MVVEEFPSRTSTSLTVGGNLLVPAIFRVIVRFERHFHIFGRSQVILSRIFTEVENDVVVVSKEVNAHVISRTAEVSVQAYIESGVSLIASHLLALCQMSAFHFSLRVFVHSFHRPFDTPHTFSMVEKLQSLSYLSIIIVQHTDRKNGEHGRQIPTHPPHNSCGVEVII